MTDDDDTQMLKVDLDAETHNQIVPLLTRAVMSVADNNRNPANSLFIMESLMVAILVHCVKPKGYDEILDSMSDRVRGRLAEARLLLEEPAGSA